MDRMTVATPIKDRDRPGSAFEVLHAFAKLGVSCFGGPIAHIGYFRQEFVVRRRWLDEQAYADLVALCQFLPGPASSQVGFSLGLMRAGYLGGLAAWVAFTLPSAIALVLFAYGASALEGEIGSGLLHGLKLVAVGIVAQAVWGMARTLCPDRERASIAVVAALIILLNSSSVAQIGAIVFGGIAGLWLCRAAGTTSAGGPPCARRVLPAPRRPTHFKPPEKVLLSEFGLSMHLETQRGNETRNVLIDFGYSSPTLLNNLDILGIDPAKLDAMVLSHGHYDHFGLSYRFLEARGALHETILDD
jgi:chromate transport protein ChrA